jgi:hypothetical protein
MSSAGRPNRFVTLGNLIPLLLFATLLADIASRFVSYDAVCFRAWEAVQRFSRTGQGAPFEPNRTYSNDHAYGDLASLGNYPALRQYRKEVFTTDAFGFRNRANAAQPYAGILVGTSFSAGCSLSDDETVSSRLEGLLGRPIYNAAGADLADERVLVEIVGRLKLTSGTVINEYDEASEAPYPAQVRSAASASRRDRLPVVLERRYPELGRLHANVRGWLAESPLKLTLFVGFKHVENDSFLPNRFASAVVPDELVNGDPILFRAEQVSPKRRPGSVDDAVAYWQALRQQLRAHDLELLVVLVPSQYIVYGPLSRNTPPSADRGDYLGAIERGLVASGVPVVNLTETFRAAARDGLEAHRYIYWHDDTHWNRDGAALAARKIADAMTRTTEAVSDR